MAPVTQRQVALHWFSGGMSSVLRVLKQAVQTLQAALFWLKVTTVPALLVLALFYHPSLLKLLGV